MLNFRKLKQDFSSNIVKEGKELFEENKVIAAKLLHLDAKTIRIQGKVQGQYDNVYESELEIDRLECEAIDSDCDCPYNYDCQHIAALLFFLEQNIDKILVAYSKENDIHALAKKSELDKEQKKELIEKIKQAETKVNTKEQQQAQKELIKEYFSASEALASSPFFRSKVTKVCDRAEVAFIFLMSAKETPSSKAHVEFQLSLRLQHRSKPLIVANLRDFFEALRYEQSIYLGGKPYLFSFDSFEEGQAGLLRLLVGHARLAENATTERTQRVGSLSFENFGLLLAEAWMRAKKEAVRSGNFVLPDDELPTLPGFFEGNLENPLRYSAAPAQFKFVLDYLAPPVSKLIINPYLLFDNNTLPIEEVKILECLHPGMIHKGIYYGFAENISLMHIKNLLTLKDLIIPEPLIGSFIENALPELSQYALVDNEKVTDEFVTLPYAEELKGVCDIVYLNGELEASLSFSYDGIMIPAANAKMKYEDVVSFVKREGILARSLVEERKIIEEIFQDFQFLEDQGIFITRSDKKIVEFMTDIIPRNKHRITFNCPQNLLDQFIYDNTEFSLYFEALDRIDAYQIRLKVHGPLKGVRMDSLWDCIASKRAFLELDTQKNKTRKADGSKLGKILVLDLERIVPVVHLFDELGIEMLDDHTLERPLWSLANMDKSAFNELPVKFSMDDKLQEIRKQILGEKVVTFSSVPKDIQATLRSYQMEGVHWLERLRSMYLSGILADDMGLGKTLQAIVALSQYLKENKGQALVVCPTSLLYNWKEEIAKFNPKLKAIVVDGIPQSRKKLIDNMKNYDIVITSYTLLQKDIESYQSTIFSYVILDEAQHIKNRGTRNAKSAKAIRAKHRLILSGTPIENSLDELWSLFDFLMPGFLSSYERFIEKYVRVTGPQQIKNLEYLKKKVSPFILRRMKADVLDDLPPVSEIVYHCQLSPTQLELYRSYAESARNELVRLVEKEGFDKVQIHVLATLTRLKQICCHPAIFAKENPEIGDSAKYDMLVELLQTLIEGGHKTVIFSQYTKMLKIMSDDFTSKGIRFAYLDGSSKNRLDIVKEFNEDKNLSVFLVSLKAGGTGLNLVGADTVIHYDMWWNPAVEAQATDRVHRMGQKSSVSSYKLITLGTIEEKIAEMQKRKKGLVKKVVSCDDEAIAKLTWEDVLELLKT